MGYNIVKLANEILDMNFTINTQASEIKRLKEYEKKYNELLNSQTKHNNTMMGNYMGALLGKGESVIITPKAVCLKCGYWTGQPTHGRGKCYTINCPARQRDEKS